jgi:DNA replication and repair protein RecF
MDDIFEKLDENRMVQLLAWVSKSTDGQVFITDTHKDRLTQLLGKHLSSYQLIEI